MKVLVIKTSSLGDILHTFPALTDALKHHPDMEVDWLVDESLATLPGFHPGVKTILPIPLRRWKKLGIKIIMQAEFWKTLRRIREKKYDLVIDAQGLFKSAIWGLWARGPMVGLSFSSAREPMVSLLYRRRVIANWSEHAVTRLRQLFAGAFKYPFQKNRPDYGLDLKRLCAGFTLPKEPYYVFLHGTTWETKHWPESRWISLGKHLEALGYKIQLLWGNPLELERAKRIQAAVKAVEIQDKLSLAAVAALLASAKGIVTVDTGLGHLAAALNVPTVSVYGPTDPNMTGTFAAHQIHLASQLPCSPCFAKHCRYPGNDENPPCLAGISAEKVLEQLLSMHTEQAA